jgi:lipopolysaccharide heptosyltransferase II
MNGWEYCKNILCIRADNMGDVIMTTPAFSALKKTFGAKLTLLTSKNGSLIAPHIKEINETITFDLPWVQTATGNAGIQLLALSDQLKTKHFDGVIIFTVYSQSALPAALLAFLAEIPRRLAYCRENPYNLLTHWLPDKEPYSKINHQVERDLALIRSIGAIAEQIPLSLQFNNKLLDVVKEKLAANNVKIERSWIILHPGVSEQKRRYPDEYWVKIGKLLVEQKRLPVLVTGSNAESGLTEDIAMKIGDGAFSLGGKLDIEQFIVLISASQAVISVNTGTIHISAATQTPQVVLYAQTNPQHTPWKSPHKILPFSVDDDLRSKNEIIRYVNNQLYSQWIPYPSPEIVISALDDLISPEQDSLPNFEVA